MLASAFVAGTAHCILGFCQQRDLIRAHATSGPRLAHRAYSVTWRVQSILSWVHGGVMPPQVPCLHAGKLMLQISWLLCIVAPPTFGKPLRNNVW